MSPASSKSRLEFMAWLLDSLPENLRNSATAEALRADLRIRSQRTSGDRSAARLRPGLTQPSSRLPTGDATGTSAPFAPRNAWGAALRARVPPMHDVDKLRIVPDEGSILDAKRGSELEGRTHRGAERHGKRRPRFRHAPGIGQRSDNFKKPRTDPGQPCVMISGSALG